MKQRKKRSVWTALDNSTVIYLTPDFLKWKYRKARMLSGNLTEAETNYILNKLPKRIPKMCLFTSRVQKISSL